MLNRNKLLIMLIPYWELPNPDGCSLPVPTLPFGMVQLSPDNQAQNWKAGYEYTIGSIFGFSHIHAWTMSGLSVMPTRGILRPGIYPHADAPISTGRDLRTPFQNRQKHREGKPRILWS